MPTSIKEGSRVIINHVPPGWFLEGMLQPGQMDTVIRVEKPCNKKIAVLASQWCIPVECLHKHI